MKPQEWRKSKAHVAPGKAGSRRFESVDKLDATFTRQLPTEHQHTTALGDEKFSTVEQVAGVLNVCTRTVRRWIERKKLIAHDFEGIVRIAGSDLEAFIVGCRRR